jgi:hypothetical protein
MEWADMKWFDRNSNSFRVFLISSSPSFHFNYLLKNVNWIVYSYLRENKILN